ncbi:hypothetical protein BaRGS_00010832 [Batillaria attramentaria]|uniref:Uncharacterized protein n=1 Tax=Batillaria attramentaria TaxID=370345 RepID=A0ABD0LF24_9CAEN
MHVLSSRRAHKPQSRLACILVQTQKPESQGRDIAPRPTTFLLQWRREALEDYLVNDCFHISGGVVPRSH